MKSVVYSGAFLSACFLLIVPTVQGQDFQTSCNSTEPCNPLKFLSCRDFFCECEDPEAQIYDPVEGQCVITVGSHCAIGGSEVPLCVQGADCNPSNQKCECSQGFYETELNLCSYHVGKKCRQNSDCDEANGLMCKSGGLCQCPDSSFIWQADAGCVSTDEIIKEFLNDTVIPSTTTTTTTESSPPFNPIMGNVIEDFEDFEQTTDYNVNMTPTDPTNPELEGIEGTNSSRHQIPGVPPGIQNVINSLVPPILNPFNPNRRPQNQNRYQQNQQNQNQNRYQQNQNQNQYQQIQNQQQQQPQQQNRPNFIPNDKNFANSNNKNQQQQRPANGQSSQEQQNKQTQQSPQNVQQRPPPPLQQINNNNNNQFQQQQEPVNFVPNIYNPPDLPNGVQNQNVSPLFRPFNFNYIRRIAAPFKRYLFPNFFGASTSQYAGGNGNNNGGNYADIEIPSPVWLVASSINQVLPILRAVDHQFSPVLQNLAHLSRPRNIDQFIQNQNARRNNQQLNRNNFQNQNQNQNVDYNDQDAVNAAEFHQERRMANNLNILFPFLRI